MDEGSRMPETAPRVLCEDPRPTLRSTLIGIVALVPANGFPGYQIAEAMFPFAPGTVSD